MVTVSIQEIRFNFDKVKAALERGEKLTLTYRNKPLAKLIPFAKEATPGPDPALLFGVEAAELDPMSNEDIDKTLYA